MATNPIHDLSAPQNMSISHDAALPITDEVDMPKIKVGALFKIGLLKVNDITQTFEADFVVMFQWESGASEDDHKFPVMKRISVQPSWIPDLKFYNTDGSPEFMMDPIYYRMRNLYICEMNWKLVICESLELHNFPFDRQALKINMFVTNCVISEWDNDLCNTPDTEPDSPPEPFCIGTYSNGKLQTVESSL